VLYTPETFEPLTDSPWDEERVRAAVRAIVADADDAFDPDALWPAVDGWDTGGGSARLPLTALYAGAAGVILGLETLGRRGHAASRLDLADASQRALEKWRAEPDSPEQLDPPVSTHASLFGGETGPLVVACLVGGSPHAADDDLLARARENVECETNELFAGSPGTMLAAKAMLDRTGEERWADVWRQSAEVLLARRDADGLWTYPPYGRGLGASHGVGTNTNVLLQGGELLQRELHDALRNDTAAALARTAVVEDGFANWPMAADEDSLVGFDGQIRVQWDHGGAGVVTSAADYLDEELLLAGAELVWHAGPLSMDKGPGICHGTAGNGYALLKTFGRTGDERWLDRARRFAVHALEQVERWRAGRGQGRYSLWTGDIGAAVYAADCLDARTTVPVVDGIAS
jgi:Lanthionine synthetase C-like protein